MNLLLIMRGLLIYRLTFAVRRLIRDNGASGKTIGKQIGS
jgi:hypothetical protein